MFYLLYVYKRMYIYIFIYCILYDKKEDKQMTKQMSNKQRAKELINLMSDGENLNFSSKLMSSYNDELILLQEDIKNDKEKRKQWLKQ